jgi:hypothetical protein
MVMAGWSCTGAEHESRVRSAAAPIMISGDAISSQPSE